MSEETQVAAEPSPAPVVVETPIEIPRSGSPEYTKWRTDGSLPDQVKPKTEESAPSDAGKDQRADADDSPTSNTPQERSERDKAKSAKRFQELLSERDTLKRELEEARKPKTEAKQPESKPEQPQTYADYRKTFKPMEWVTKYGEAHPDATYEDAQAAMVDHLADARDYFRGIESTRQAQAEKFKVQVDDAKSRYPDFDGIKDAFLEKIQTSEGRLTIPGNVAEQINDSDVFVDLVYTLGSDEAELAKFVEMAKTSPTKAIRYITKMESLIEAELAKTRNEKGQFQATEIEPKTPAKRGPESAPAPPLEIGSRGSGTMDEAERALQAVERGDGNAMRTWMAAENRKELNRRRGV